MLHYNMYVEGRPLEVAQSILILTSHSFQAAWLVMYIFQVSSYNL